MTLGTMPPTEEHHGLPFLLDVDVQQANVPPTTIGATLDVVELLHERETAAFEAMITNKTRDLFQ